jgi:antitoxin component of MazEF toxin-antitoxin module
MQIKTTTRKWGNSIAVVIPDSIAKEQSIKPNQKIEITIEKQRPKAGELWGLLKDWKKSAQEIKDEAREGWLSDSDREREKKWTEKQK